MAAEERAVPRLRHLPPADRERHRNLPNNHGHPDDVEPVDGAGGRWRNLPARNDRGGGRGEGRGGRGQRGGRGGGEGQGGGVQGRADYHNNWRQNRDNNLNAAGDDDEQVENAGRDRPVARGRGVGGRGRADAGGRPPRGYRGRGRGDYQNARPNDRDQRPNNVDVDPEQPVAAAAVQPAHEPPAAARGRGRGEGRGRRPARGGNRDHGDARQFNRNVEQPAAGGGGDRDDADDDDGDDEENILNEVHHPEPQRQARPQQQQQQQQRVRIGFHALQQFTLLEPEVLLQRINVRSTGFLDALGDERLLSKPDCMAGVLSVIVLALRCEAAPAATNHLLNTIRTSPFLTQHLSPYFTKMQLENSPPRLRGFRQPIKDALNIYRHLLYKFPESILTVQTSLTTLDYVINSTLRPETTVIDAEVEKSLEETKRLRDEVMERQKTLRKETERAASDPSDPPRGRQRVEQPPDDFRQMSIFPDADTDLHTAEKPFLRENVIKGSFQDAEHYLDVQFRLLREDFIRPLRNGIREYLELQAGGDDIRHRRRLTDVRIYYDVCVLNPVCTPGGVQYRIRFDAARTAHVNWKYSKRLIFGSLLCLSSDNFTTIRIATVSNRDPNKLKDGELIVQFELDPNGVRHIPPGERFLMIETSAYFEAYRHVLSALQDSREQDIPFLDNIVLCLQEVEFPQYLRRAEEPEYDLRAIAGRKPHPVDSDDDDEFEVEIRQGGVRLSAVNILQPARWPTAETLHLDASQHRALQTALTKRISIIQGPPGTGKTYIGLKIVQVLLENSHMWNANAQQENSPILVVCYTNHALDQFLEGLCKFVKTGILRVGGRSKSKRLEQFLLKELRRKTRENRDVPRAIFLNRIDARSEMELHQVEIERQTSLIEGTEKGLVHEEVLHEFMFEHHFEQLVDNIWPNDDENHVNFFAHKSTKYGQSMLPSWLGLENLIYQEEAANVDGEGENAGAAQQQAPAVAEDIEEMEDEAQAEENERIIEDADEDDEAAMRRQQEERRRQRNAQNAEQQLAVNFDDVLAAAAAGGGGGGMWTEQRGDRKKKRQRLRNGLHSLDIMGQEEVERVRNIWTMRVDDRWRLYRYWLSQYRMQLRENVHESERNFQLSANRMKEILEQEDMAIMRSMKIIGMTTTGAARYKRTLRTIQPKIVIVEEAAEVLEAHVITTLSGQCQHLILIGDHKQLRPSPNVYELAENYNLKYSLFERLVMNELQHETLERQHRMRPEIAQYMRLIYDTLIDDDSVMHCDDIKGVSKSVFFINHDVEEQRDEELKSVSNEHEAKYLVALCNYLVLQGYSPSQITILAPYVGQIFVLKRLIRGRPTLEGVIVCPIDNYQGEENDIILLSMVRSNVEKKIGFVKEENRTCVALSRAKIGLYVIGNFKLLTQHSELWSKVIRTAKTSGAEGNFLELCCQNHPALARIEARRAQDFDQAPEGGCMRPCGYRLECGHACERVCHSYDRDHSEYKCRKPCQKKVCQSGHACSGLCFQKCKPCQQPIRRRLPNCGHDQMVPCSVPVYDFKCQAECRHPLSCGHACQNKCGDEHTQQCEYAVRKICSNGHATMIKCYQRQLEIPCKTPCGAVLECTHKCSGSCGECFAGRLHKACASKCGRTLVCSHPCDEPCTRNCPPCKRKCENRCNHSKCPRECGRPCEPCREPCMWRCVHFRCTKLCHEPCNRPRCDQPCTKLLECGHQCIGMCGETCPSKCRICDQEEVTEIFLGQEDEPDARYVQLEDCKHIFEVTDLDQWMDQAVERTEATGIQLKECPRCKVPIRRNLRYGPIVNEILNDIEQVKSRTTGNQELNKARARRLALEIKDSGLATGAVEFYIDRLTISGLSTAELDCIENVIKFSAHIQRWQKELQKKMRSMDRETKNKLEQLMTETGALRNWINVSRTLLNVQEIAECTREITRYDLVSVYYQVLEKILNSEHPQLTVEKRQQFSVMLRQLTSGAPMNDEVETSARKILEETERCMTGLGISEEERLQVLKAVSDSEKFAVQQGHWFKCPNGHLYVIADCGGATVESRCPECKAQIGGVGHQLRADNHFAPEMDGAAHPAWPGMAMNH